MPSLHDEIIAMRFYVDGFQLHPFERLAHAPENRRIAHFRWGGLDHSGSRCHVSEYQQLACQKICWKRSSISRQSAFKLCKFVRRRVDAGLMRPQSWITPGIEKRSTNQSIALVFH